MTPIDDTRARIRQGGIVAILRGDFAVDDMLRLGEALLAGGVDILEVTLNSKQALAALPELRQRLGSNMLVGAGTVRWATQVQAAAEAGAQFLVSPNFDPDTVLRARGAGLLHLPGVFTATEAQTAYAAGCSMLKLFPADTVGPAYLKALRAPLDDVEFVPTGGVSLDNIAAYARAGAAAVGLGSQLVAGRGQASAELTRRAAALRAAWQEAGHG
jgi:2-dehydro-3-deoxyphosphogluconate aldolase / (4S)-4-hydroxy-2-oxoglutarate aldolase